MACLRPAHLAMELRLPFATPQSSPLPEHSSEVAFQVLAEALTTAFHGHLREIMEHEDVEPVHKARVALRRFRAAVSAFRPVIDEDLVEAMQDRARILFRILGGIRDADVIAARFAGTDLSEGLANDARIERRKARKKLKKHKAEAFSGWVLKRLKGKSWRRGGKKAKALRDAPVASLAAQALDWAWKAAMSNGIDLDAMSPRAQHELRKDLKMLRYLSEFFIALWPAAPYAVFLSRLCDLQDDLGEVADSELARALGNTDSEVGTNKTHQAAEHWSALRAAGPWWIAPATA